MKKKEWVVSRQGFISVGRRVLTWHEVKSARREDGTLFPASRWDKMNRGVSSAVSPGETIWSLPTLCATRLQDNNLLDLCDRKTTKAIKGIIVPREVGSSTVCWLLVYLFIFSEEKSTNSTSCLKKKNRCLFCPNLLQPQTPIRYWLIVNCF